jgi:hypothetical protein
MQAYQGGQHIEDLETEKYADGRRGKLDFLQGKRLHSIIIDYGW